MTCTTTQRALTWNLTVAGVTNSITRTLSTTTRNQEIAMINSATLLFSRVSELSALPLISMLVVPAVSQGLNGTRITCMELRTAPPMATTTLYIYGGNAQCHSVAVMHANLNDFYMHADQGYQPNPPKVDFEEEFEVERVTVHLNWTQSENPLVSYSVSVVPGSPESGTTAVPITDITAANLALSYNTLYNVTVVANFCGQRNAATCIKFSYGTCTL